MGQFIKVNGPKMDFDLEGVCRFGKTDQNMKEFGKKIWQMVEED
jgi:hypothetical protein